MSKLTKTQDFTTHSLRFWWSDFIHAYGFWLTCPLLARVWSVKFSDLRYKLKTNIHKKFLILILAWKCHNFTKSDRHNLSEWAVESCFVVSFDTEIPLFCFAHSSSADHLSLMSGKVHDLYCSLAVCNAEKSISQLTEKNWASHSM